MRLDNCFCPNAEYALLLCHVVTISSVGLFHQWVNRRGRTSFWLPNLEQYRIHAHRCTFCCANSKQSSKGIAGNATSLPLFINKCVFAETSTNQDILAGYYQTRARRLLRLDM